MGHLFHRYAVTCSATIRNRNRIASSRNAPEQVGHCLTRMLPGPRSICQSGTRSMAFCYCVTDECCTYVEGAGWRGHGSPLARGNPSLFGATLRKGKASFLVRSASLLSRPDLGLPGRGAQRRGLGREERTKGRSHPEPRAGAGSGPREHGEDGEHRTFPEVSTVARLPVVG